ncbi:MAG: hypothetical protein AB8B85_13155 [Paracoccaceae bacterium]
MVMRPVSLPLVLVLAAACTDPSQTRPIELTPHGNAVRHNTAAQIVNPIPPRGKINPSDAARATLAVEAYRAGEVKDPTESSATSKTTDVE